MAKELGPRKPGEEICVSNGGWKGDRFSDLQ
jgi:hypothetical protein